MRRVGHGSLKQSEAKAEVKRAGRTFDSAGDVLALRHLETCPALSIAQRVVYAFMFQQEAGNV